MKPTGLFDLGEDKNDNEHLTRLIREKRQKIQISNIRNERGGISTDPTDIKK